MWLVIVTLVKSEKSCLQKGSQEAQNFPSEPLQKSTTLCTEDLTFNCPDAHQFSRICTGRGKLIWHVVLQHSQPFQFKLNATLTHMQTGPLLDAAPLGFSQKLA